MPIESVDAGPNRGVTVSTVPLQTSVKYGAPDGHDCMIGAPLGFEVAHVVPAPGGLPLSE